jgi:hypothetical protein
VACDRITTDIVMVNLFPYLAVRYQATDVPTTVADGRAIVVGSAAEEVYVEAIVRAAG